MKQLSLRQLTQMAMLAAISITLVFFIRFPIMPAAPFLEYTPAEVTQILATFLYGPAAALILTVVVAIIQGMTVSAHSGIIGVVMNILSTGSFVLVMGFIYRRGCSGKRLIVAMVAGIVATCVAMALWNIIVTPIFMGVPREVVVSMILPVFVPFNLIRAGVNSLLAYMAWRALGSVLERVSER